MTWFKVDDSFPDHPKVLLLQSLDGWEGALALWTLAGAWSSKHLTEGAVTLQAVTRLGFSEASAKLLVVTKLWRVTPTGYQFHAWLERNPKREVIETKREATRNRVAKHRGNALRNADCNALHAEPCNTTPVPSRPVPSQPEEVTDTLPTPLPREAREVRRPIDFPDFGTEQVTQNWAGRVTSRFRSLHLQAFQIEPNMGGKQVHAFPSQLKGTAEARSVDPLKLLDETFRLWSSRPRDKIAQGSPYAAFCARFGELVVATQLDSGLNASDRLLEEISKASREGRANDFERLDREWALKFGGAK